MPKTFCLLNHELTQKQISELDEKFGSKEIIYPTKNLSEKWAQISPEKANDEIVVKITNWLRNCGAVSGDFFIVQGEFGATFELVDFALKNGLVPIYAASKRIAKESRDGEKIRREYIFEHIQFKRYKYF